MGGKGFSKDHFVKIVLASVVVATLRTPAAFAVENGKLTGKITDVHSGQPIWSWRNEGAEVWVYNADTKQLVARVFSDQSGNYSADLAPGSYVVDVDVADTSYAPQEISVTITDGGTTVENFALKYTVGELKGTVTDVGTGKPVWAYTNHGALIHVIDNQTNQEVASVYSDINGNFDIPTIQEGSYTLHVEVPDTGYDTADTLASVTAYDVTQVAIQMKYPYGTLSGTVTDADTGNPVWTWDNHGAKIDVLDSNNNVVATTTSDTSGAFSIGSLHEGTYSLHVSVDGSGYKSVDLSTSIAAYQTTNASIQLTNYYGIISGNASINKQPIAGAQITVLDDKGNVVWQGAPDQNGNYSSGPVPTGSYTVKIASSAVNDEKSAQVGTGNKVTSVNFQYTTGTIDTLPPQPPVVNSVESNGTSATGTAEQGAVVTVSAGGVKIGSATAGPDGTFTVTIPAQQAGTVLTVTATDAAGNVSEVTQVTVTAPPPAPSAPTVNPVGDTDITVTGTATPGCTVSVESNGNKLGTATVASDGSFTVTIPKQATGTTLDVYVIDGNNSQSPATHVQVQDKTPPEAPVVHPVFASDTLVTGTTEANALVKVMVGTTVIGQSNALADGTFSVTIPAQPVGTSISVTSQDAAGNTSAPTVLVVQADLVPHSPSVDPVKDTDKQVTGTADPGSVITVKVGSKTLGTATADSTGKFTVVIPAQTKGTALFVTSTSQAGTSDPTRVTVYQDDCFIATAAFGSKFEPNVTVLRAFRDAYLMQSRIGRSFVEFYYRTSPPIANHIAQSEWKKQVVRGMLYPVVYAVSVLFPSRNE